MIGLSWLNGGRHEFEKSVEWANKALAIDDKSNEAFGLVGDADVEMGKYDEAFVQYQKMLDIHPDLASYSRGAHMMQLTGDSGGKDLIAAHRNTCTAVKVADDRAYVDVDTVEDLQSLEKDGLQPKRRK